MHSRYSRAILCLGWATAVAGCNPRPTTVNKDLINANLLVVSERDPMAMVDALESLIAASRDTKDDRKYAYLVVSRQPVNDASGAFARAAAAGRLAESSGLSASGLVAEVEQFAQSSIQMDPDFRRGAARRMLGTLWVVAPAALLKQGDSEKGLELLIGLAKKWPQDSETRLRLAEAYVTLDDIEPAYPHLCFCLAHGRELRPDDQKLLTRLVQEVKLDKCP
jgi:hypothetical protein